MQPFQSKFTMKYDSTDSEIWIFLENYVPILHAHYRERLGTISPPFNV